MTEERSGSCVSRSTGIPRSETGVRAAIAWIALTPLLVAMTPSTSIRAGGLSALRAFLLGLLAGGIYLAGTLYWLSTVMSALA